MMFEKFKDKFNENLQRHAAGATVRHKGVFSDLSVLQNEKSLDNEFIEKYVNPFYMVDESFSEYRQAYLSVRAEVNKNEVAKLLGEFNWRPRSVGAYFSALENMNEFEDNIGNLLLRSDVCYAGHNYCLALASFSTEKSVEFLNRYLDYYLMKPDLWFEQGSAMAALFYLGDELNEDFISVYMDKWQEFIEDKKGWELDSTIEGFKAQMEEIFKFRDILKEGVKP